MSAGGATVVAALEEVRLKEPVVSIGNFDGVHLGHRMLLGRMRELAQREGRPSLVVTFFPPAKVVFGHATFLSSAEEKLELLAAFAPEAVVMIPFSQDYARTDKARFVDELRRMAPTTIIVGEDFRFGHQRAGGLNDLSPIAGKLEAFGLRTFDGEVVKSSHVREHLKEGNVVRANVLLGAPYRARGRVREGQRRGRSIGYPTANVETAEKKALPVGVFAVTVDVQGATFGGMANVGPRPSFPEEPPSLEVHVFDFDDDLYDRTITTYFHAHLRKQMRFASLDELRRQLERDEADARAALTSAATLPSS